MPKVETVIDQKGQDFLRIYDAMNVNADTFVQKIKVNELSVRAGTQKFDRNDEPILSKDGKPEYWDDKYYVTYTPVELGGSHSAEISQKQYEELQEGSVYFGSGCVKYVQYKDTYNTTPKIIFLEFVSERDYFVSQIASEMQGKDATAKSAKVK